MVMGSSWADEGAAESSGESDRQGEDELPDCCLCWNGGELLGLDRLFSLTSRRLSILIAKEMGESRSAGRLSGALFHRRAFSSEGAKLNGIVGDPFAPLSQSHQGACCLSACSRLLEDLSEGFGGQCQEAADKQPPVPLCRSPGFCPSQQVRDHISYFGPVSGESCSLKLKMKVTLSEEGSAVT